MHILHLAPRYPPARGGSENHIAEISTHLVADGHQVTLATTDIFDFELLWNPKFRRVPIREEVMLGVRVLRFPIRHIPPSPLTYPALRRLLWLMSFTSGLPANLAYQIARFTPWVPSLWRWLNTTEEDFDIVAGINICFEPFIASGLNLARRRGVPFLCYPLTHLGAGPLPGRDQLSRFYTMPHQTALIKQSDAVIAQTETERQFYISRGVSAEQIWVLGPGTTPDDVVGGDGPDFRQRYQIEGPLVVSLSAMAYDKGTVQTTEAIRQLWQRGCQVELVLAGAILSQFRHYFAQLPKIDQDRIHLLGSVTEEEKRNLLAAADMLVMPSRTDSFGMVYLEAWLYEKPVIGAKAWGIDDVITEGEDGLLVPFGDVSALAEAIDDLINHPAKAALMGKRGAEKVYRWHTWQHKIETLQHIYSQLVN